MKTDRREQKDYAYDLMERIGICTPLIGDFANNDRVYYFDNFHAFPVECFRELNELKCKFELENDCTVYAITHEKLKNDDWYTMLFIPNDADEWLTLVETKDGYHHVYAYVASMLDTSNDDIGYVFIQAKNGGIKRIA